MLRAWIPAYAGMTILIAKPPGVGGRYSPPSPAVVVLNPAST